MVFPPHLYEIDIRMNTRPFKYQTDQSMINLKLQKHHSAAEDIQIRLACRPVTPSRR